MSTTKLSPKDQLAIWLRAGGRCEYPGCNDPLWKDDLTLVQMNRAYLAHIIADKPNGPRGDVILSEQHKADPSNIMLLCDTHHRLIDQEAVDSHPADLLYEYKQEHEERIERLTAIQGNRRTQIVLFGTQIGDRQGYVNYEQAREAVLPERYPADERGIRLDLTHIGVKEDDPEFWGVVTKYIDRELGHYLSDSRGPSGHPLNHLSVFALAPIPALIYFGMRLGDIRTADVYQCHRHTGDWQWKQLCDPDFGYLISRPILDSLSKRRIALNLSLSGTIHSSEIEQAMSETQVPIYTLAITQPHRSFLQAKEQLELFRNEWYKLLSEIREKHGEDCEIHLFAAVPNSVAVEIGRALLLKADPYLVVYDRSKDNGFYPVITI